MMQLGNKSISQAVLVLLGEYLLWTDYKEMLDYLLEEKKIEWEEGEDNFRFIDAIAQLEWMAFRRGYEIARNEKLGELGEAELYTLNQDQLLRECIRLRNLAKGPGENQTWYDAAVSERIKRKQAEEKLRGIDNPKEQESASVMQHLTGIMVMLTNLATDTTAIRQAVVPAHPEWVFRTDNPYLECTPQEVGISNPISLGEMQDPQQQFNKLQKECSTLMINPFVTSLMVETFLDALCNVYFYLYSDTYIPMTNGHPRSTTLKPRR